MITASDWHPMARATLRGFVTLKLEPSGIVIRECTLHERDGKRWVALPGRPQLAKHGQPLKDLNGKVLYVSIVEIAGTEARTRFQKAALAAIYKLLGTDDADAVGGDHIHHQRGHSP